MNTDLQNTRNILEQKAKILGLTHVKHHIFLCCDQTKPCGSTTCCSKDDGLAAWEFLKNRLNELNLTAECGILRSKANCLRICNRGPIAVIYPDNVWYHSCSPAVLEQIIQSHLINNTIVKEYQFNI
jgi:(2Fe-2S) ferredoxin